MRLPERLCGASCQRHARKGGTTTAAAALLLFGALWGTGRELILSCSRSQECVGGIVLFFVEVCLILNMNRVELMSSF